MSITGKYIRNCIALLLVSVAFGFLLLVAVYLLPVAPIKQHVFDSTWLLEKEGNYSEFLPSVFIRLHPKYNMSLKVVLLNNRGMARDNYTDSLMLGAAAYDDDGASVIQKALLVPHDETLAEQPLESLLQYAANGSIQSPTVYPRYWHGYLVFLKPLLTVFNYSQIRIINTIILSVLLLLTLMGIHREFGKKNLVGFVLAIMFTFPIVIPYCMQYCTMTYIMLIAVNTLLYQGEDLYKKQKLIYFWLFVGIATAYFDFLTYPALALGVGLVIQELLLSKRFALPQKTRMKAIILSSVIWLSGYGCMWAAKWVLAQLLTDENVITDALNQILRRTVGEVDYQGRRANPITAVAANFSCFTNVIFLVLIIISLVWFAVCLKKRRANGYKGDLNYVLISFIPIVWYILLTSHSFDHSSFTYRALMVSVYALLCYAMEPKEEMQKESV